MPVFGQIDMRMREACGGSATDDRFAVLMSHVTIFASVRSNEDRSDDPSFFPARGYSTLFEGLDGPMARGVGNALHTESAAIPNAPLAPRGSKPAMR
jgi:hypothetical protein